MITINSFTGIKIDDNEILFGMTQTEVKKILGQAAKIEIDNIMKVVRELRWGMTFNYENKKLTDIDFSRNVENLEINNIKIFDNEHFLSEISKFDEPTPEGKNGYINFYNLGICIGGFGKRKIPEKQLVIAFSKGKVKYYEFFLKM